VSTDTSDSRDGGALPRASVVVPVFNAVDEIGRLLDSLLAQEYPRERLEIIVVDNGSSDGTDDVVADYPVKLVRETDVQSSYAARNRGVAEAEGEWIAFTDADCFAPSGWLRALLSPPLPGDVGAVAGEVEALELDTPVQRLTERFGIMKHAETMHHKAVACFSTANVAVRRDVLTELGGFRQDTQFFGDMDLSWRMQLELERRLLFRPEAVILHRHRRTWRQLWRHGRQHGRGVAFMKKSFPEVYRIDPGEQLGRIAGVARAAGAAVGGLRKNDLGRDRWLAPFFLATWYLGMGAGYVMGPARSRSTRARVEGTAR
jgi:glycosyltransferase involved in cell wall biosynthesis